MGNLELIPSQDDLYPQQSGKEPGQSQQWSSRINNPIPRASVFPCHLFRIPHIQARLFSWIVRKHVSDSRQMGRWLDGVTVIGTICLVLEFPNLSWKELAREIWRERMSERISLVVRKTSAQTSLENNDPAFTGLSQYILKILTALLPLRDIL